MAMVIGTNVSSLTAQRSLEQSSRLMEQSMERLSTGKAINSGADDAAGLAKSMRMDGRIAGLSQASKNIADGSAMVAAIDSSLEEVSDVLVRMRELSVQAASDTTSDVDRGRIQNEYAALQAQLDSIANNTRFNGQEVLNGSYTGKSIQIGAVSGETISVTQGSVKASTLGGQTYTTTTRQATAAHATATEAQHNANTTSDHFTITVNGTSSWNGTSNHGAAADSTAESVAAEVNANTGLHGVTADAKTYAYLDFGASAAAHELTINGTTTGSVAGTSASSLTAMVNAINAISSTTGITATETASDIRLYSNTGKTIIIENQTSDTSVTLDAGDFDGSTRNGNAITLGANGGTDSSAVLGNIRFTGSDSFTLTESASTAAQNITGTTGGGTSAASALSSVNMSTQANASAAMGAIDGAISAVAKMRGDLGATANRLEHSADSVLAEITAVQDARSQIVDADYAQESANLAKAQVLQQVGTAMLAQANASPQLVLQLVQ